MEHFEEPVSGGACTANGVHAGVENLEKEAFERDFAIKSPDHRVTSEVSSLNRGADEDHNKY